MPRDSYTDLLNITRDDSRGALKRLHFQGSAASFREMIGSWETAGGPPVPAVDLSDPRFTYNPFSPFLDALRLLHREAASDDSLWKGLRMFPSQERSLRNWISGLPPAHEELPLCWDFRYEGKRLLDSIVEAIERLSATVPLDLAIANAQLLSRESIELLSALSSRGLMRGLLILHFDWDALPPERADRPYLDGFRTDLWVKYGFHELPPARGEAEPPPAEDAQALLESMASCSDFFTPHQGLDATLRLNDLCPESPAVLAALHYHWAWFLHHTEAAKSMEASFNYEEAASHYQLAIDFDSGGRWTSLALSNLSEIASASREFSAACDRALSAAKVASERGDRLAEGRALVLYHMASMQEARNDSWDSYRKALRIFEEEGSKESLVMGLINYAPVNRYLDCKDTVLECIDRALALSRELGHRSCQAMTLNLKGIVVSLLESEQKARPFFEEGISIRSELGDASPLIGIQNGLSYSYLNQGDLRESFEYLRRSILILGDVRDFHEICMTLLNLAQLYLHGRRFELALPVLDRVLEIMRTLGMRDLPFNSITNVEVYRAFCALKTGKASLAAGFAERIDREADRMTTLTVPYYALLKAFLGEGKGRDPRILPPIDWDSLSQDNAVRERVRPFFDLEWALHLLRMGDAEGGKRALERIRDAAANSGNALFRAWVEECLRTGREPTPFAFPELGVDLEPLSAMARQELNVRSLHRKMRDIQFINRSIEALALLLGTDPPRGLPRQRRAVLSGRLRDHPHHLRRIALARFGPSGRAPPHRLRVHQVPGGGNAGPRLPPPPPRLPRAAVSLRERHRLPHQGGEAAHGRRGLRLSSRQALP